MGAIFVHKLDLQLRLIDTTTGRTVTGRQVELLRGGERLHARELDGSLLLINTGREDFDLTVRARGFDERTLRVEYEKLDEKLPAVELHLIPNRLYAPGVALHTLEWKLEGLTSIDAVKNGDSPCLIRGFDERKRIMTIFNPHGLEMKDVFYGVVDPEKGTYEVIEITKRISDTEYKLSKRLEREFGSHFPVTRLVFGGVRPDGSALLRVRNAAREAKWLVRCTVNGEEAFRSIDFNKPETLAF